MAHKKIPKPAIAVPESQIVSDQLDSTVRAQISKLMFLPELSAPQQKLYTYQYVVELTNSSSNEIVVNGREWAIRDGFGTYGVNAPEVAGLFSKSLPPRRTVTYTTAVVLRSKAGHLSGTFHWRYAEQALARLAGPQTASLEFAIPAEEIVIRPMTSQPEKTVEN